jgi:flagellar L-ring protein precursor FlgH
MTSDSYGIYGKPVRGPETTVSSGFKFRAQYFHVLRRQWVPPPQALLPAGLNPHRRIAMNHRNWLGLALALGLTGCMSTPAPTVVLPTKISNPRPQVPLENTGSIFKANSSISLFEDPSPFRVGDLLTVEISESLTANNKQTTTISQSSDTTVKGPGATGSMSRLIKTLFDLNAEAKSSTKFTGSAETSLNNSVAGSMTVVVVDVQSNGNLLIAGDKTINLGGNETELRFSGVVNRKDIRKGNLVDSKKVGDAKLEQRGHGVIADTNTVGWMQRLFLSVSD